MTKYIKAVILLSLATNLFSQGVIINEIMNAPQGGEPEWIEILNFSSEPVNLKNWKISNRNTSTKYTITNSDYILQPDSYAVITKSDTIFYFHSNIPSKVFMVSQMPTYLFRNDSDAVVIFDSTGFVIDSVYYKRSWVVSGYSIERIYPNGNSNLKSTWGISIDPERSTPGRKNSIMAKFNDLAIKTFTTEPAQIFQGVSFKVKTTVYNIGINPVESFKVEFLIDVNKDSIFQDDEKFAEISSSQRIESTDSTQIELNISGLISGDYRSILRVLFPSDENTANNFVIKTIKILPPPLSFNSIVINEIMYAPKSPEPEWIELYNRTNEPVNLKNWKVGDSQTLKTINVDFIINPADFIIITSKDTLPSIYPWLNRNKILILSLPAFNNDEDAVRIYDQYENLIDSVYYFSIFGGTNGFSLERVSPDQPSNSASNWGTSKSPFRATPLLKNSLTQKDKDLTITNIRYTKPILKLNPVELNIAVKNIGKLMLENFTVKLINHENGDLIGEKINVEPLAPADSTFITFHFTPTETKPYILTAIISHPEDEDTLNNSLQIKLEVSYPEGSILINEIMFAPLGDEPEWIEIYNASDDTINLKNWYVSDASSEVTITKSDFLIFPKEYLVLSKDSTILNFYDINSNIITLSLPTFNNSGDAVAIYDHAKFKIDSLYYFGSWGKAGSSIERIDLTEPSIDSLNWSIPPDTIKATPGKENFSRRKNFDLRIRTIQTPNSMDYDKTLNAQITVQNWGLNQVNSFSVKVYNDINFDSTETENELIFDQNYQVPLNKKDSVQLNIEISNPKPGENSLIFSIDFPNDEDLKNNRIIKSVNVGFPTTSVIINEIMFEPLSGYCEYIELFNRSDKSVNLKNWKFNDMRSQDGKANFINISSTNLLLNPGEYLIIAPDSTFFKYISQGDSINFKLVVLNKSLNLNNDFDDVIITDLTGKIIDSVRYYSSWHSSMIIDKIGRALEKINPNLPSFERSSWTSSSSQLGGTPGRKNTAFIDISQQIYTPSVKVTPNPFSPDGDGFEDICLISYVLPFNSGILNVKIFDSYGRIVRNLAINQFATKSGNLLWDGTSDDGRKLRIGIYIILFEAESEQGEKFQEKLTVVLARKL